ncbi:DUF2304 domain-containing protein [Methanothermococcus okinawensis]|uniref:DUF2304 domain-containing protein n=1 Tax=Methanothermococcus okinawensis (strain DSM 14208 / JCM 11175 / IH1) TaxID=647113 RepID=F8ALX8_METOI|nr:DUF2304 family protein [Methanothermococcus okinawensis]AEH06653.1 Protein of unknown function DUF2304 [Methanothermococcus okinawensis IH1]
MHLIQILAIIFAIFAISRVVLQVKSNSMSRDSALFWIFVWITVILAVVFPNTLGYLATLTGVGRGVDVLIYFAIIVLFYLIYRIYVKMENIEREITTVVREVAIIEREKKEKEGKNKIK